ncbi:MAG: hypothetical protein K6T57_12300 [Thermaceae bacterium]|nr:hypothetical protein [Thermaceae bacterium]
MNATTVLMLGGAAVLGVGLAIGQQRVMAERSVGQSNPGSTFSEPIPTHTTNPQAEAQTATWRQLLSSYKSDLMKLQGQKQSLEFELQALEKSIDSACTAYAQNPRWGCDSEGFLGQSNRCTIKGTSPDEIAYKLCRSYGIGAGSSLSPSRQIPFQNSFNLSGSWRDTTAEAQFNNLLATIADGYRQTTELRGQYATKQAQLDAVNGQIADLNKRIADLNARGVY